MQRPTRIIAAYRRQGERVSAARQTRIGGKGERAYRRQGERVSAARRQGERASAAKANARRAIGVLNE
jgi:hypothetical protein